MKGFDCAAPVQAAWAGELAALGYEFFARYYRRALVSKWAVSPEEAKPLFDAGLWALAVFQNTSDTPAYFTEAAAIADAQAAVAKARQMGQPPSTAIYFAVDCNPDESQIARAIIPYFDRVMHAIVPEGYLVGVYGSGLVCRRVLTSSRAAYAWLSNAKGWRGSVDYFDWHVHQTSLPFTLPFGLQVDNDEAVSPQMAGLWRPA